MAGRLELLIVFWKAWGVQAVVLLSFALQVTLLLTANIRRHKGSLMIKAIIWLAYVLADTTAVYALGHMSVTVTSPEHQLMALWAPLLLVHLGGQDNITAYAIEDNRLWMRHLQTFGVQVVAAAYVIYESSILGRNTLLRPATILMFVDGILKYGERVWALVYANNCASRSLSATNYKDFRHVSEQPDTLSKETTSQRDEEDLESHRRRVMDYTNDQELQFEAYMKWDIPKQMYKGRYEGDPNEATSQRYEGDPNEATSQRDEEDDLKSEPQRPIQDLQFEAYMMLDIPKQMLEGPIRYVKEINNDYGWNARETSKVVEMQLSMMSDLFYTKAAVVHTWYGWCIRIFSLLATIASLILFHASNGKLHGGYNRVDVLVTYVLLAGAVVLEITSVLRTIFSTWTCVLLLARGWRRLSSVLQFFPQLIRSALHVRYWSGSMGQLSLLEMSYRSRRNLSSKIARWMGRGDWWDSIWHSTSASVSEDIIRMVVERVSASVHIRKDGPFHIRNSRGKRALHRVLRGGDLEWTIQLDLDESILVWHIAIEIYYVWQRDYMELWQRDYMVLSSLSYEGPEIFTLSRYMAFLLAAHPYMLPYPVSRQGYVQLCYDLVTAPKDLHHVLFREVVGYTLDPDNPPALPAELAETHNDTLNNGWRLAQRLIGMNKEQQLVHCGFESTTRLISEVSVEMLCYTAYRCNENYHAKHLSNGGEILTSIALLMLYMSAISSPQPETPTVSV